jgi:branched-chain amino acid aminotransferase
VLLDGQKLNPYDLAAGHKTLNYFSRLAALREANRRGAGEALWFSVHNFLESGSIANVFMMKDGALLTPPTPTELQDPAVASTIPYLKSCVLPGVTRALIFDLAREAGLEARPAAIDVNVLLAADEAFLTNSVMGVMPVCRIERKALGNDKPGPVTRLLMDALARAIETI